MDIPWHEYSGHGNCPITEADLTDFTKSRNYMFDRYRSDVD